MTPKMNIDIFIALAVMFLINGFQFRDAYYFHFANASIICLNGTLHLYKEPRERKYAPYYFGVGIIMLIIAIMMMI